MESGRARATDRGSGGLGQAEGDRFEAVLSFTIMVLLLSAVHCFYSCNTISVPKLN